MDKLAERANRYYLESYDLGITDTALNDLPPGRGALCESALLYIDLDSYTSLTSRKSRTAYLKFSHIYLSLLFDIVSGLGARKEWTTRHGDGILAYFTDDGPSNNVWNAMLAALYARTAVKIIIPDLSPLLRSLNFSVVSAIHHDTFLAAEIGPWGGAVKPVGAPVRILSKMRDSAAAGSILVTRDAVDRLDFATLFGDTVEGGNMRYNKILFRPAESFRSGREKYSSYRFDEKNFEKLLGLSAL